MEPNEKNSGWAAPHTAAIETPIEVQSVRQLISANSDNLQAAQNHAQAVENTDQYVSGEQHQQTAPAKCCAVQSLEVRCG